MEYLPGNVTVFPLYLSIIKIEIRWRLVPLRGMDNARITVKVPC